MPVSSAQDLITASLRLLNVVEAGGTPTASALADSLDALNEMLSSWAVERLMINQQQREQFTLTAGLALYAIGPGGSAGFITDRPVKLEAVSALDQTSTPGKTVEYPNVRIRDADEWARIPIKSIQAPFVTDVWYDGAFPNGNLSVYPTPSLANAIVLYTSKLLKTDLALATVLSFPPGYKRALRYNLAVELASEFGRPLTADIVKIAEESKESIKRINIPSPELLLDPAIAVRTGYGGKYSVATDGYYR